MLKVCSNCHAQYWARWRNEPVTLCPDCREDAVLCMHCLELVKPPPDADQLTLWPIAFGMPRGARGPGHQASEHYTPPPRNATQGEKRKYPYH